MAYAFANDDGVTVTAVLLDKKRLPESLDSARLPSRKKSRWTNKPVQATLDDLCETRKRKEETPGLHADRSRGV
jgi:hypothetical protein